MQKIENITIVPVVDAVSGEKIDEREFHNIPFSEFYDEDFIVIDWMASGQRPTEFGEYQLGGVEYDGNTYYPYAWGSMVKRGQTFGFLTDIPRLSGVVQYAEDAQRVGRWLFAQGVASRGTLKVGLVPAGTIIPGAGPVDDGFGYIRKDLVQTDEWVTLGNSREQYPFWQRLDWDIIKDEQIPLIHKRLVDAGDPTKMLFEQSSTFEQKQALVKLDQRMIEHPFVANSLSRVSADRFARMATCGVAPGFYRTIVPTECETVCWPGHQGDIVVRRSPIDSNGSIQAVHIEPDELYERESKRISNLYVIQHTIATTEFAAKGCLGLVDDLGEFDVILCNQDVKMVKGSLEDVRRSTSITLDDAVLVEVQGWGKGSLAGVNGKWAKNRMGADHDGDGVDLIDANAMPQLVKAVKALKPGDTPKLKKTKTPLMREDKRNEMICKSMSNLVGFASNVMATSYAVKNRELLAKNLGFKSEQAFDKFLNYAVKVGTDGFKTDVDAREVEKQLAMLQSNLQTVLGGGIAWTGWPNDMAFTRSVPNIITGEGHGRNAPKGWAWAMVEGKGNVLMSKDEIKNSILPWQDGIVPTIARIALPALDTIIGEPIKVRPLTEFQRWAGRVDTDFEAVRDVQNWYNARVRRVNFSEPKDIAAFKLAFSKRLDEWMAEQGLSEWDAARALWNVAHGTRSELSGAASVFIGFPEQAAQIVADKPGLVRKTKTVLVGLARQVPGLIEVSLDVEIQDVTVDQKGRAVIRKAVVAEVHGQRQPNAPFPEKMIGLIAGNAIQPEPGQYKAHIKQVSAGAWDISLT